MILTSQRSRCTVSRVILGVGARQGGGQVDMQVSGSHLHAIHPEVIGAKQRRVIVERVAFALCTRQAPADSQAERSNKRKPGRKFTGTRLRASASGAGSQAVYWAGCILGCDKDDKKRNGARRGERQQQSKESTAPVSKPSWDPDPLEGW